MRQEARRATCSVQLSWPPFTLNECLLLDIMGPFSQRPYETLRLSTAHSEGRMGEECVHCLLSPLAEVLPSLMLWGCVHEAH